MATEVKCPNCSHAFPIEEVMAEEYKKELRNKMLDFQKKKDEEFSKKEQDFLNKEKLQAEAFEQKLAQEKAQLQKQLEENLRKSIANDFENQMLMLQNANKDNEEKLRTARQKELEFLKKDDS